MQWNQYRVLVAAPQTLENSALVISADRAGGLGILNGSERDTRDRAIRRMRDFWVRSYAIRVHAGDICQDWLDDAGENLVAIVCHGFVTPVQLKNTCALTQATGRRLLCEVRSVVEAELASVPAATA